MKLLISTLIILLLVGCSGVKQIETYKVGVKKTPLNLELPSPLDTNDLEFIVINKDTTKKFLKDLLQMAKNLYCLP